MVARPPETECVSVVALLLLLVVVAVVVVIAKLSSSPVKVSPI